VSQGGAADGHSVASIGPDTAVRLGSAAVLAVVALAGAFLGGWLAVALVCAAVVIVHSEWIRLTGDDRRAAAVCTLGLVVSLVVTGTGWGWLGLLLAVATIAAAALTSRGPWRPLGVAYSALLGFGLLLLRLSPEDGFEAVAVLFAVVWLTDSGAFVAGRLIGGPKLAPRTSPKKTWSGAIGGLALGTGAGVAAAAALGLKVDPALVVVLAALSLAALVGDLIESVIKRRFGAKDSGHLIPGHGGLMDRVDGLTFAAALAVVIGAINGGPAHISAGLVRW
jgi:phosphatidate cytidylyltransferase